MGIDKLIWRVKWLYWMWRFRFIKRRWRSIGWAWRESDNSYWHQYWIAGDAPFDAILNEYYPHSHP